MNTPDIDIERLREAVDEIRSLSLIDSVTNRWLLSREPTQRVFDAARFLVSLADQDGELWVEKPCPECGGTTLLDVERDEYGRQTGAQEEFCSRCNGGGSRVRVWPKEGDADV